MAFKLDHLQSVFVFVFVFIIRSSQTAGGLLTLTDVNVTSETTEYFAQNSTHKQIAELYKCDID